MYKYIEVNKKIEIKKIFSVFEQSLSENFLFQGETHNFWEFLCVEEGQICVSADDRVYHLTKGDIIFHKPMELHKFHVEKAAPSKIFVMSFTLSGTDVKKLKNVTVTLSEHQKNLLGQILSFLHSKDKEKTFSDYFKIVESLDISQALSCITELFLLSFINENSLSLTSSSSANAILFKKAVLFMDENINAWVSIDEISKHLSISASYLKKIFVKYTGLGVHKYFLKLKIIRASTLLRDGMSVSKVSDELSFSSQNYFSLVFKRETGTSPLAYKKDLAD